jgi:2-dehydro-3-deoxyphosphogluconate aldolase/(4S)-4-hydroxy-2-oxoglutarate aldolase
VQSLGEPAALSTLREQRVLAVIRASSPAEALGAALAIAKGGIRMIEIAFTVPDAPRVISELSRNPELMVGAGTVLDGAKAQAALAAGARFVVAPNLNAAVGAAARVAGVMYMPGAYTPSEIVAARAAGADLVKVYPVGAAGGPQYIKVIRDPLPDIPMLAAGGTTLDNMLPFLLAGCVGVGLGAALCDPNLVGGGHWSDLTTRARSFVQRLSQAQASGMLAKIGA